MSLFTNLINLHSGSKPLEDFFTEIVAYFFSINKHLLIAWLKHNLIISDEYYSSVNITTQKYYELLENHEHGSQPDIVIQLANDTKTEIIFIESKIGSTEGWQQLKNYAEILNSLPYYSQQTLIYVTRDYEPKQEIKSFIKNNLPKVKFYQIRWYHFHNFLKNNFNDILAKEILMFMEINKMSQNNQLSPVDILAMKSFNKTLNFMEATLSEEVKVKFQQLFAGISIANLDSLYQFKYQKRYIIGTRLFNRSWGFWCGLGYFDLEPINLNEYPSLGVCLEVESYYKNHKLLESMQTVIKDKPDEWFPLYLQEYPAVPAIIYKKSLQSFLATDDQLSAIKQFFLDSIDELKNIQHYFDVPWKDISAEEVIAEDSKIEGGL
ncbi:MAG: PD-(D/E)XK nuclease family protein [Nostoc sp. TH1S01]|nr:PD-(D/E)XK nuclease family protein [Nostoc sp. TH1S01]